MDAFVEIDVSKSYCEENVEKLKNFYMKIQKKKTVRNSRNSRNSRDIYHKMIIE